MHLFRGDESEDSTYLVLLHPVQGCRMYTETLECLAVKET